MTALILPLENESGHISNIYASSERARMKMRIELAEQLSVVVVLVGKISHHRARKCAVTKRYSSFNIIIIIHHRSSVFHQPHQPHNDTKLAMKKLYLVICNIQKFHNVRALLLSAAAFGCHEVLLVGQTKNKDRDGLFPPAFEEAVTQQLIRLQHFAKWNECLEYITKHSIYLIGVEIDDQSRVLDEHYFSNQTQELEPHDQIAIFMGNEGQGIHPKHLQECKSLVRIPQYGVGTASLNVNVAANIVLYRFHLWMRNGAAGAARLSDEK